MISVLYIKKLKNKSLNGSINKINPSAPVANHTMDNSSVDFFTMTENGWVSLHADRPDGSLRAFRDMNTHIIKELTLCLADTNKTNTGIQFISASLMSQKLQMVSQTLVCNQSQA